LECCFVRSFSHNLSFQHYLCKVKWISVFRKGIAPADKGSGGKLGKTDLVFSFFLIQYKGFWYFLDGRLDLTAALGGGKIGARGFGDGGIVGVKNADDVFFADIFMVTGVEVHGISFLLSAAHCAAAGIYVLSLSLDKESTKENEQGALPLDPRRAAAHCSHRRQGDAQRGCWARFLHLGDGCHQDGFG
jgi:hypothetical protein